MDFKSYLESSANQLDQEIERILKKEIEEAQKIDKKLTPLLEAFASTCIGGKKIRGTLVKLGYKLARGKKDEIFKVGTALEIMHAAILAHDDIIDQSPTRRGRPSLYKSAGVPQAITLADYGFFLAIKIISESNFATKVKNEALKLFARTMVDTAIGQMLDIQKGDALTIMRLKTAGYSISGPLKMGAILAGADEKLIRVLDKFGENLGIAFQIRDDILDGEETVDFAQTKALKYVANAKKLIPEITMDPKKGRLLQDMADYLVERNI